mgnify:CR=1 FL=1|jgi:2-amino-4-hydroxy-6-hydroxymethyldihydropteridine diphosphokinase
MNYVFLSLGANLGDRERNINEAIRALGSELSGLRRARLYETVPQDVTDQPLFLNTAVCGYTSLEPASLLQATGNIERLLGRPAVRSVEKGPRTVDIDILLIGNMVIETPDLVVPHPRMNHRKFVLVPLLELDPLLHDPVSGVSYRTILGNLPPQGIYYRTLKDYTATFRTL